MTDPQIPGRPHKSQLPPLAGKQQRSARNKDSLAHAQRFAPPPRRFLRKLSGKR